MTRANSSSITIRDVARRAGVSVATVSRYLNQNAPVSPEVAERLEQVMAELNYTPHASARNLATHRTNTIGLLLMDITGDFFAPLISGIENVTRENGYDLLISSRPEPQQRRGSKLPLGAHNVDGLLIFANSLDEDNLAALAQSGFPLVLIHQSTPEGMDIPCVTVENKAASAGIVSHLIEQHKRKRIVFLRGPEDQEDSRWREMGYREALAAHDIAFDPALLAPGEFSRYVAQDSIRELVKAGVKFDAVFAGDDESAVGALAGLAEAGLRVPEDVSVVGFDDQRMSPYLTPPLTTVRAPTERVGEEAACQLLQRIRQGKTESLILLPTELIVRRSCGCGG